MSMIALCLLRTEYINKSYYDTNKEDILLHHKEKYDSEKRVSYLSVI